jgi:hypothetical protein
MRRARARALPQGRRGGEGRRGNGAAPVPGAAPLRAIQLADCSTGVSAIFPHSAHDPS